MKFAMRKLETQLRNYGVWEKLLPHSVCWLLASLLLDIGTAWMAMSALGAAGEENAVLRSFFELRDLATFEAVILQPYTEMGIVALGLALGWPVGIGRLIGVGAWRSKIRTDLYMLGVITAMGLALKRFCLGTVTNIAALLTVHGQWSFGAEVFLVAVVFTTLMLVDVAATVHLMRRKQKQIATQTS